MSSPQRPLESLILLALCNYGQIASQNAVINELVNGKAHSSCLSCYELVSYLGSQPPCDGEADARPANGPPAAAAHQSGSGQPTTDAIYSSPLQRLPRSRALLAPEPTRFAPFPHAVLAVQPVLQRTGWSAGRRNYGNSCLPRCCARAAPPAPLPSPLESAGVR